MTKKSKTKKQFNLNEAIEEVNPFLRDGFLRFIKGEEIKSQKKFNELIKSYGELR